jgi:F-type H+-transporting ATPase subunit delta
MSDAGPGTRDQMAVPTVFDEQSSELARTYADALLNAAQKAGRADEVLDGLDSVLDFVTTQSPAFAAMIRSPLRSAADNDRVLTRAFEGRVEPIALRFLRVLNRHGRLDLLGPALRSAREAWDRRRNRQPVTVRSAVALTEPEAEALRGKLAASLGGTPVLRQQVDPGLIGGLVVQVGDDVYDASVRHRLEQLRHRLTEGKTHEIQSRRDHFSHSE